MRDVSVLAIWNLGGAVFTLWFALMTTLVSLAFARISTHLSLNKIVAASAAMSGVSWLFVGIFPIPLYAYVIVRQLLWNDRDDPISWGIPVVLSAMLSAFLQLLVLAVLRSQVRRSKFWLLALMNLIGVGVAVWRMVAYVNAHPPEA